MGFTKPKTIPCQHTFCQNCLKNLQNQSTGPKFCPVCRKRINFSKARLNKDLGVLSKYLEENNPEKKDQNLGKVMKLVKQFEDQLEFSEVERMAISRIDEEMEDPPIEG